MKHNVSLLFLIVLLSVFCGCKNDATLNEWDSQITVFRMKDGTVKFRMMYEWMGGEYEESCSVWEQDSVFDANTDSVILDGQYFIKFPSSMDNEIEKIIEDYFVSQKELPDGVEVISAEQND